MRHLRYNVGRENDVCSVCVFLLIDWGYPDEVSTKSMNRQRTRAMGKAKGGKAIE